MRAINGLLSCPTDALTELFSVWDEFPIHHTRRSNKPLVAIGQNTKKQLVIEQLQHRNYIKRALYYQELLETGQIQSQRALAEHSGTSQAKVHSILKLLHLDEEIKDFIFNLGDTDPKVDFLAVYRLQPLLCLNNQEVQRKKFWEMVDRA